MKKLIVIACAVTSLLGCVSQEQLASERAETAQAQNDLDSARTNATVSCNNKQSCEKAFSLAKIYVQENSDMKIQLSDDTMVSTYNPTQYGYNGVGKVTTEKISRGPGRRGVRRKLLLLRLAPHRRRGLGPAREAVAGRR